MNLILFDAVRISQNVLSFHAHATSSSIMSAFVVQRDHIK